ncbi:MAG: hypothetical protein VYA55_07040 [Pseudomonadota bacterium]|nr:hypothetical protein [Pseudomonadota bacterium]
MKTPGLLLLLFALLPLPTLAASDANISGQSCSGDLSVSVMDSITYVCAGNLSLIDGTLTSDQLVSISAEGNILIENLTISAPLITLTSTSGNVSLDAESALFADELTLSTPGGFGSHISVYAGLTLTTHDDIVADTLESLHIYAYQNELMSSGGQLEVTPVPVPATALLLLSGLLALLFGARKRAYRQA